MLAAGAGVVASETAASLGGYLAVWSICAAGGFLAAVLLFFVPKVAFADTLPEEVEAVAGEAQII